MSHPSKFVLALALALAAPLTACGATAPAGGDSGQAPAAATSFDISTAKTLGDVLSAGEASSSMWNESRYACFVDVNGAPIFVVAEMTPEIDQALSAIDFSQDDYEAKRLEALADCPVIEAVDLSSSLLGEDERQALVGKTGQELMDQGFAFAGYTMYGGDETMADMEKDGLLYWVTLDGTVSESVANSDTDEGAAIKDYKAVSVEYAGVADSLLESALEG